MSRRGSRWDGLEVFLDEASSGLRIEVTCDDEGSVCGDVVSIEEIFNIIDGGGANILFITDDGMSVGMVIRVEHRGEFEPDFTVGLIFVRFFSFVEDDVTLFIEFVLGHSGGEVLEAIGFDEEDGFEHIFGSDGIIVCDIFASGSVIGTAAGFE